MLAILLMCAAVTFFSCLDAMAKHIVTFTDIPPAEVIWLRFVGQVVFMCAIVGPAAVPQLLRTKRPRLQALRSLLMALTTAGNFVAVKYLRLDQTVSIAFLAPLAVALLAGPILGEYVGWRRMIAILTGFLGILIVVRPGIADVHPAILASLASMTFYSLFMITTRKLSGIDPPMTTLFCSMIVGTVGGAFFALPVWVWPTDIWQWLQLASLGALGGLGHYILIFAYQHAPASVVSPFLYFQLLSMVTLGYLVFGDLPDAWTLVGASVVIASGIYLVHRERVVKGKTSVRPVP